MPSYFACAWQHDKSDEPVLFYEELDDDRMELRRVEEFHDSRRLRTDRIDADRGPALSSIEVPPLKEIDAIPELTVLPLSAAAFQATWDSVVDG